MEKNVNNKSKNSLSHSIKFVLEQAKKGSKVHIAIIAGTILAVVLAGVLIVSALSHKEPQIPDDEYIESEFDAEYNMEDGQLDAEELEATILPLTEKGKQEYLDNTLFIGDSNTVRTMMYGYTTWDNVVAAVSMGVQHINSLKMTFFKGMKDPVTVPEAVKIIQPQRIIITYGTNNLTSYKPDDFVKEYKKGIDAIVKAYPYADIIINAIPPIDKQRENIALTMQQVDSFNKALAEFAQKEGYKFLNSSEALKDEKTGFAKTDFTIGDGVHLNMKGMEALFDYILTHTYETEDKRPKPLKAVPAREETPTGIISEDPIAVRGSRIRIVFQPNDSELGRITGEVEQKIKRGIRSQAVTADPNLNNGGIFMGWSCSVGGLSSTESDTVTFTVPQVAENVTEIYIIANFARAAMAISETSIKLDVGSSKTLAASVTESFRGDKNITWKSSDTSVATVDEKGVVKAVRKGSTSITASILDGKISVKCDVSVAEAPKPSTSPSPSATPTPSPSPSRTSTPAPSPTSTNTPEVTPTTAPTRPVETTKPEESAKPVEKCEYCQVEGHTTESCPEKRRAEHTCTKCGELGHYENECTVIICLYCNGKGHTAENCPNKIKKCERCGSTDHEASAHTCSKCNELGHTDGLHCPVCNATEHGAEQHASSSEDNDNSSIENP